MITLPLLHSAPVLRQRYNILCCHPDHFANDHREGWSRLQGTCDLPITADPYQALDGYLCDACAEQPLRRKIERLGAQPIDELMHQAVLLAAPRKAERPLDEVFLWFGVNRKGNVELVEER